ncbi:MAG TPA: YlaH-like family protein [Bacillales bacterium]|nr:YlaH-like family protein [Bacillales bacterium]
MGEFFSDFARLYGIEGEHPQRAFWLLYATILFLSAVVYRLGFARKLPLLKNVVIFIFLAVGCFVMTIFAERFPVVKCLIVIAVVFGGYKWRLHRSNKRNDPA